METQKFSASLSSLGKTFLSVSGVSFAIFLGLLQVSGKFDTFLLITLLCFVLIFPINLVLGFVLEFKKPAPTIFDKLGKISKFGKFLEKAEIISFIISGIGIISLIMHYSIYIGLFLIVVSIISFFIFSSYLPNIKKE